MEQVKLIWDFRGPNAIKIAEHHAKHLKEFTTTESLENTTCDTEQINPMHCTAFLITPKDKMDFIRERLKPNRGQLYNSKS
ncbi:hypothetical protein [Marixanthomonas ophiurae]|uniref:Uncharacterized protein n=1 Tax=Marixanthomonas ophiurae TaxID=387659 RepID=A0A3E1QDG3_9FLAO|nr:hypothetical protein [Marixanthomonas ophiurae]RFN60199.1 hypothetical protein DZ858_09195 [Marixanthomonas ophiurae]